MEMHEYRINDLFYILPFTCSDKPIENIKPQSKRLFTTVEGIKGLLCGHELSEKSVLKNVLNGVYKISVKYGGKEHVYLGQAASVKGIEDRIVHHVNRLRSLPLRHEVISTILKKKDFKHLSKNQAREVFRSLEFANYSDLGDFFDLSSNNPFSRLARVIRQNFKTYKEQKKFFSHNVFISICHIPTGVIPSEVDQLLISLLEIFFIRIYIEETGRMPSLNSHMPADGQLIDRLKKLDQTDVEISLEKFPENFRINIINKVKEKS